MHIGVCEMEKHVQNMKLIDKSPRFYAADESLSILVQHNQLVGNLTKTLTILLYVIGSIMLILVAVFIAWHLLTTEFPTHSDVFWTGVQSGALGVLALIFLTFGMLSLFRVATRLRKPRH